MPDELGKMRLDAALFQRELASSREQAQQLIGQGLVYVNGKLADRKSLSVFQQDEITVAHHETVVGRGAYKLQAALEAFGIDLTGKTCLDVGASTGGFTQVMLRAGATKVYAVDVGAGQLASELRADPRVVNLEKTDIRLCNGDLWAPMPEFCSIDVSFISLSLVLPAAIRCSKGDIVALVKPQFEAGRSAVGKKGIVKNPKDHVRVLEHFCALVPTLGMTLKGLIPSPIRGGEGNVEYLMALSREGDGILPPVKEIVSSAFGGERRRS